MTESKLEKASNGPHHGWRESWGSDGRKMFVHESGATQYVKPPELARAEEEEERQRELAAEHREYLAQAKAAAAASPVAAAGSTSLKSKTVFMAAGRRRGAEI